MELLGDESIDQYEWKPRMGMAFDSEPEAYEFYNEYGRRLGFGIRKHYFLTNKKTKEMTSRVYVCYKEGVREEKRRDEFPHNPRPETRTGCLTTMGIKLDRVRGKFIINRFLEEHNHEFAPSNSSYMLVSQRKISDVQATEMELADESGIPIRQSHAYMSREVGGRECLGFTKVDHKNYLRSRRMKKLAHGEAGSIMKYFERQTVSNPSFYYGVQFDCEEQITNIFWADARMIIDYSQFGDVVSFDTTYKINNEHRPCASFVGFNHHRETVVFGAALMYDETTDSFKWLFETFLEAMSHQPPKTILTDQDPAMARAVREVMPSTFHRLCKWHIMQNATKHLSNVGSNPGSLKSDLAYFMDYIDEKGDFIVAWEKMLDDNCVRRNTWLNSILAVKEKWAHAYVRLAWNAGMKSTQLSESFNAFLKDYMKLDIDVVQFFMHFERVLAEKRHKELESDFALSQQLPQVKHPYKILTQVGKKYTKIIFGVFQLEFLCSVELISSDHVDTDGEGNKIYTVATDSGHGVGCVKRCLSNDTLSCSCRLFEMSGILCRHALKILRDELKLMELPTQYILKRWTRDARSTNVQDMYGRTIEVDANLEQNERYKILMTGWRKLSDRAAHYKDSFTCALQSQYELQAKLEEVIQANMKGEVQEAADHSVDDATTFQFYKLKKRRDQFNGKKRPRSFLEKKLSKLKAKSKSKSKSKAHHIEQDVYIPQPPQLSQPLQIEGSCVGPPQPEMLCTTLPCNGFQELLADDCTWHPSLLTDGIGDNYHTPSTTDGPSYDDI